MGWRRSRDAGGMGGLPFIDGASLLSIRFGRWRPYGARMAACFIHSNVHLREPASSDVGSCRLVCHQRVAKATKMCSSNNVLHNNHCVGARRARLGLAGMRLAMVMAVADVVAAAGSTEPAGHLVSAFCAGTTFAKQPMVKTLRPTSSQRLSSRKPPPRQAVPRL
jgi:hypothetical protein